LFYFAEQITESAKSLGFTEEEAKLLVQKTILGSTLLWELQQVSPETLRKQVSSPGGTTLAALNHFQSKNVGESIKEGIQQAYLRAKELTS
jgi:pyrroline-5-carboxylate reductase